MKPAIVISSGDPSGIGPEVTAKALGDPEVSALADWIVVGDAFDFSEPVPPGVRFVDVHVLTVAPVIGRLSQDSDRAAVTFVLLATKMCLRGEAAAMVTAPLNKEAVT